MGQGRKWPTSLLLTLPWGRLSPVGVPNHKGAWETCSFVPMKERTNIVGQLAMTSPGGQFQVREPYHKMTYNCWTWEKNL